MTLTPRQVDALRHLASARGGGWIRTKGVVVEVDTLVRMGLAQDGGHTCLFWARLTDAGRRALADMA